MDIQIPASDALALEVIPVRILGGKHIGSHITCDCRFLSQYWSNGGDNNRLLSTTANY